ncbi:MAG: sensor histidine kinase [bacterium]
MAGIFKKTIWLACVFFSCLFFLFPDPVLSKTLEVGIYQDYPMVFQRHGEDPQGFFIDVLEEIARREGWKLRYRLDSFAAGLRKLENAEIDILTVAASSESRRKKYDFNKETVLPTWGQIYSRKNSKLQSILDLNEKTLAVVKDDIYYQTLKSILDNFELKINYMEFEGVEEYEDIFRAVQAGRADALVVNRLFGHLHAGEYGVQKTPIVCCPVALQYAFPKGRSDQLISRIDHQLANLKKDQNSIYYRSLNRWFKEQPYQMVPTWFWWALAAAIAVVILFLSFVILLRYEVDRKTAALRKTVKEKEALLHEVFHRVKNNMQSVISFLQMEEMQLDSAAEKAPLIRSMNRVQAMSIIHNLIYSVEDFSNLPVHRYLKELVDNLIENDAQSEKIVRVFELEEVYMDIDRALALGMLTNELLTNCLRHAFKNRESGLIRIQFKRENEHYVFIVEDNGKGLNEEVEIDKTTTLGLKLISGIVENQLQGTVDFMQLDEGTRVVIKLPREIK